MPLVPLSTVNRAFSCDKGIIHQEIIIALQNAANPVTRNWLAKYCNRGRSTIRREVDCLVDSGRVRCDVISKRKQNVRLYSLTNTHKVTRRKDGAYQMRCPSCNASVRFRRDKSIYVYNCRCGYRQFVENPMEG